MYYDTFCFFRCYLHTSSMEPFLTLVAANPKLICTEVVSASATRATMLIIVLTTSKIVGRSFIIWKSLFQDHTFGKASPYLHEQVNQTQKRQISRNDKKPIKIVTFFRTIRQNRKEQRQREVRALMRPACRPLKSLKTSSTVRGVGLVNPSITLDPRRMN